MRRHIGYESAGAGEPALITLGAGEDQDVLVAGMFVESYDAVLAKPDERGRGTGDAVRLPVRATRSPAGE